MEQKGSGEVIATSGMLMLVDGALQSQQQGALNSSKRAIEAPALLAGTPNSYLCLTAVKVTRSFSLLRAISPLCLILYHKQKDAANVGGSLNF